MPQHITCPNCQTPFSTDIISVVDVGRHPELKTRLLSGTLNVAQCPNCGAGIQLSSPMIYHDPAHELFMAYVPMEMNLPHVEQQKLIGEMVRQVMDNTPPEKRRAYMLQPLTIINLQTFYEKVLETEGITKEMINRQRKQAELVETLATADKETSLQLIEQHKDEIDETFFGLVESALQSALQDNDSKETLQLTNLQARLYRHTDVGQRIEKQRAALRKFQQAAQKQGGLSPELVLDHILNNEDSADTVEAIGRMVQSGLNYQFFQLMTNTIDRRRKKGNEAGAARLEEYREMLLDMQREAREETQQMMQQASGTLQAVLSAESPRQAIRDHLDEMDDAFLYLLNMSLAQAEQAGNKEQAQALRALQQMISEEIEEQMPPEVRLVNQLASTDSIMGQNEILDEHPELVNANLLNLLQMVANQQEEMDEEFLERIKGLAELVRSRLN